MKKIAIIISAGAFFIAVGIANPLNAQGVQKEVVKSKPIPAAIASVMERSCVGCHSENGNAFAKMHFNFTKWNEYSPEEQTSIGQDICKMVTKSKMPPKKFLKNKPEAKLSAAEKTVVCDWASELMPGK